MPIATLSDGTHIRYEIRGAGPAIVLTTGGRRELESLNGVADALNAGGYQVLLYDRRNTGASDFVVERRFKNGKELTEQEIFVEDLHELIGQVGLAPLWVGGVSAGCRVSLLLAIRYPEDVKGLLVWRVSGGRLGADTLAKQYYGDYIDVVEKGGMDALCRLPFFQERFQQNASNEPRLRAMKEQDFLAIMRDWMKFFDSDLPVIGATEDEVRAIKVPTMIIAGDDDVHPVSAAEWLRDRMPSAEYTPPQWTREESIALMANLPEYARQTAIKVPPVMLDFLSRHEPVAAKR